MANRPCIGAKSGVQYHNETGRKIHMGRVVAEYEIGLYHIVAYHPTLPTNKDKGVDETLEGAMISADTRKACR